jgi:hypothetical protein
MHMPQMFRTTRKSLKPFFRGAKYTIIQKKKTLIKHLKIVTCFDLRKVHANNCKTSNITSCPPIEKPLNSMYHHH